jgi:protein-tyrosine phosphatase
MKFEQTPLFNKQKNSISMKVLMVCLGNICRSPLAEGVLKHKVEKLGLDWSVDSAGTGNWHVGELPDKRSIAVAKKHGIDLTDQRARHFKSPDLDNFDLILVMDKDNFYNVMRLVKNTEQRQKVKMIMNFVIPNSDAIVPDPYYDNRFDLVYDLLDKACDAVVAAYT